jgi:hypothetical protein
LYWCGADQRSGGDILCNFDLSTLADQAIEFCARKLSLSHFIEPPHLPLRALVLRDASILQCGMGVVENSYQEVMLLADYKIISL